MPYLKHRKHKKTSKAKAISLFFLFLTSGLAILRVIVPIVAMESDGFWRESFVQAPVVSAPTETQKPLPKKVVAALPKAVPKTPEAHLKIPRIGVNAVIKDMGVNPDGAMAVPDNRIDVGWFKLGTRPGETGSAVIGAHNSWASKAGVFAHLDQLVIGDVLSVMDAKGVSISFIVRDIRTYDATDTNTGIFESESGVHLNLITCSGEWNPTAQTSTKRLVIFTDIVQTTNEIAVTTIPIL